MTLIAPQLVSDAQSGNRAAQERLLAMYGPLYVSIGRRTLHSDYRMWEIGDAIQVCSLTTLEVLETFEPSGTAALTTVVAAAARNSCLDAREDYHNGCRRPLRAARRVECIPLEEDAPIFAPSPEEEVQLSDATARVRRAVASLDPSTRALIVAHHGLDGDPHSLRELARRWGVPPKTLHNRERRAVERLKALLTEED